MKDWHSNFSDVIAEAHFRASIVRLRYRVFYDPTNRLWNLRETHVRLQDTP